MDLQACLPADLQGDSTTLTPLTMGLSGAGVYRVDAGGQTFALKLSAHDDPPDAWREKLRLLRLAADAGLAPRVVHVDEARRAIVSEFVADRGFPAFFGDPRTRDSAIALLGQTLARVHALPLPPGVQPADPRQLLADHWARLSAGFAAPAFVGQVVRQRLAEPAPPADRATVLAHNDVNPGNLLYDGERLLLVDWDHAWPNDPYFDLASISVFARMDEAACLGLLTAYDGEPAARLPAGFIHHRRVMAVMAGVVFMALARDLGHPGATGGETLESAPTLIDFYQKLRAGSLSIATAEGRWAFGLALVKESFAI